MKMFRILFLIFIACFSSGNARQYDSSHCFQGASVVFQKAKTTFVKTNNAELFCTIYGKGDPILVIHGGPGLSQDYLLPQMAKLAKNNLVIFYDQRACGLSTGEVSANSIQIEAFLDDIEAIRKSFGFKKIIVVGHSWGGFLAMNYAITHPETTQKLILLNTMPASSEDFSQFVQEWMTRMAPVQEELKAIQDSPQFAEGNPPTIEKYYQIIFSKYCYNPEKALLLNLCLSPKASVNGSKVNEIFRHNLFTKPFNLHDQLKQLKMPTLIVHGDYDVISPSSAQKIHESISSSKYIAIKNCGHFPYVETPDEFFKHLNDFLNQ